MRLQGRPLAILKLMTKTAILLANLGSPDSFRVKDVKTYLDEFLMDERVIDVPHLLRKILVKGFIVPLRSPKSAEKYKSIWTEDGSPLIHISRLVQKKLESVINMPVELCMRYANPTPDDALKRLFLKFPQLETVILLPLYPHYAMSSYETAVEHVKSAHSKGGYGFDLKVIKPYYNNPSYLHALTNSIKPYLKVKYDRILFSYHGIPKRHILKTDTTHSHCFSCDDCCSIKSVAHDTCYRHQVFETTREVAHRLGIPESKFSVSFQSRLGRDEWLKPFTADQLKKLPAQGVRKLLIVCPAFVSDCLETLEEIKIEGQEIFMENGGEEFTFIPCLNDNDDWIAALEKLIQPGMIQEN